MECDIVEMSPGLTDLAFYAIDNTGAPYRVTSVQAGTGHRSIVFTTGATLGTYLTFRASARPATAGLYFVIDNFVFRKYKTVDQQQYYGTDFSAAVMSGTDVYDNGRLFRPWTSLTTSLSVEGTVDKKIKVSAGTVNESRLRTDMPAIGGVPYLVKFTLGQAEADKRAFIELLYRTGGGAWTTFSQGLFYTGSGDYQLNFTLPAGADELRVGFLRNNTSSSYDGLGVPYTIDNFSVTRITPQEQLVVTVCDPPPGGDTTALYRYGFNGKENDNEVKGEGNQQDYGMRIYDPRLGRFLSVDPLTKDFPWYTPYQYAGNKPIRFIDLDGGEESKHWYEYDFRDLMLWGQSPTNPLEDNGFAHKAMTSANRAFNPLYNLATVAFGEESLLPSSDNGIMTRTDAGFNLVTQWMFWKYAKLSSQSYAPAALENEMKRASLNTATKHQAEKAVTQVSNEEKAKIVAFIKQVSSVGTPIKSLANPGNSVVLGKDLPGKLVQQADEVGGFFFGSWAKPFGVQGQTFSNQFFSVLSQITKSGGKIFMDLDKVNVDLAKKGVGTFVEAVDKKLATEWELNQILNNKDYLKNTIFHEKGRVLTAEELVEKGIN